MSTDSHALRSKVASKVGSGWYLCRKRMINTFSSRGTWPSHGWNGTIRRGHTIHSVTGQLGDHIQWSFRWYQMGVRPRPAPNSYAWPPSLLIAIVGSVPFIRRFNQATLSEKTLLASAKVVASVFALARKQSWNIFANVWGDRRYTATRSTPNSAYQMWIDLWRKNSEWLRLACSSSSASKSYQQK